MIKATELEDVSQMTWTQYKLLCISEQHSTRRCTYRHNTAQYTRGGGRCTFPNNTA